MDLIDKRDEVLRTFIEYGITDCEWCDLKKTDLADCAEAIVKKLIIPSVSQQRELLKTFCEYVDLESHAHPDDIKLDIENHINVFNCG